MPFGGDRFGCPQSQVRGEDLVGLPFHRPSDSVGKETDGGQGGYGKCDCGEQHDDFAGTQFATE